MKLPASISSYSFLSLFLVVSGYLPASSSSALVFLSLSLSFSLYISLVVVRYENILTRKTRTQRWMDVLVFCPPGSTKLEQREHAGKLSYPTCSLILVYISLYTVLGLHQHIIEIPIFKINPRLKQRKKRE